MLAARAARRLCSSMTFFCLQPLISGEGQWDARSFSCAGWRGKKCVAMNAQRLMKRGQHIFYW